MKAKTLLTEFIILLLIFISCWLMAYKLSHSQHLLSLSFEINLHDTYFEIGQTFLLLPYFLVVAIIYGIKEAFYKYKRSLPNGIWVISSLLFIALLLLPLLHLAQLFASQQGWTIYPPLSALARISPDANQQGEQLIQYIAMAPLILSFLKYIILAILLDVVLLATGSVILGRSMKK